jgi:hypothetical protein
LTTSNVTAVDFTTVVNDGGAIKKTQFTATGFIRRRNMSNPVPSDGDFEIIEMSQGIPSAAGRTNDDKLKLIQRDGSGGFIAAIGDLSQLKIDTNIAIDSVPSDTGGYLRYYGWDGAGGILIGSGSLPGDDISFYDNAVHQFRNQNGLGLSTILASTIQVTTLTTGGNTTQGEVIGDWRLSSGSRLQSTYSADLAEWYTSDKKYEAGTVLVFGGDAETTTTNIKGDTRVAGVVSTDPAYVMNGHLENTENSICLALQGRVPCRVVGKIQKGDLLVTSKIPGVAVAGGNDIKVGTVVGKALENYDSDHIGTIEIAVGRT